MPSLLATQRRHGPSFLFAWIAIVSLLGVAPAVVRAETDDVFRSVIGPFMRQHCLACHNKEEARGELDLSGQNNAEQVVRNFRRWGHIVEFIRAGAMPPEDAPQPTIEERRRTADAIDSLLLIEAKKHAGDPGLVLPRRLSRTEYDHAIRDLTGVDVRPTSDFPVDPAGGEGFDNTGESLAMSPSLLKKYLGAAEKVKSHLVLKTSGLEFAPFPVSSYNERKKLTEQAIIAFYERHAVSLPDCLRAVRDYRQRSSRQRDWPLAQWLPQSKHAQLSPRYLALLDRWLTRLERDGALFPDLKKSWLEALANPSADEPLRALQLGIGRWQRRLNSDEGQMIRSNAGNWPIQHLHDRQLAAERRNKFPAGQLQTTATLEFAVVRKSKNKSKGKGTTIFLRIESLSPSETPRAVSEGAMFVKGNKLPRNEKEAANAVSLQQIVQELNGPGRPWSQDGSGLELVAGTTVSLKLSEAMCERLDGKRLLLPIKLVDPLKSAGLTVSWALGDDPAALARGELKLLVARESAAGDKWVQAAGDFCRVFPNRFFYVDSRRGLAAGFHLVEGFFRDDQPLVQDALSGSQREELSKLWRELRFVTNSTETLLRGFVWFERSERHVLHDDRFDFLRPEDPELVTEPMLIRFERHYLERMNVRLKRPVNRENELPLDELHDALLEPLEPSDRHTMSHGFFERIRAGLAEQRQAMAAAEQAGHEDMAAIASRAFRRPLRPGERESLRRLYDRAREQGLDVEKAFRVELLGILMSPHFIYRYHTAADGSAPQPLDDYSLASRLSFFLWSSIPDERLLTLASQGKLQSEETLVEAMRRMMADDRVVAFAREFFGQWLRYRDFLENDSLNTAAFPTYTETLRHAMLEEPERLAVAVIRDDLPVTALLNSDFTFVNEELAKHYGGEVWKQYRSGEGEAWRKVEGLDQEGRGGLFGMAVVLAKNSAGERTSPVKRGFWTVHHLLGQHFPPPPADVPELPANEREAESTIRDLLAQHTENARCAMCHKHFDGLGLAMEGFDPIGRRRTKDLAGRPVDDLAHIGGQQMEGVPGLIRYVETQRRDDFVRTMCKKFLGYALGRSVMLSDRPLLDEMEQNLSENGYRISAMFETVVRSQQFRFQRAERAKAVSTR